MHLSTRSSRRSALVAVPLALVASAAVISGASYAAFSASTDNSGNNWRTGTVALDDDHQGTALFDVSDLVPGDTGEQCITVTATTTKPALVRFYGADVVNDGAADHLDLIVERGTATGADCQGFNAQDGVFADTLSALEASTSFADGYGSWTPTTGTEATVYRITYTLGEDTPNSAQDTSASATFVWEAQSK
ncbi:CalY family protein [Curtobacterium sp. P97]|uniref:CalY family protein n=1 Tax=unclassified Curtobacterium TaxID=257496 RepID=UPI00203F66A7|nr:CalY family protein [Curtobacterium sp. P97]MCM3520464.1 CalY family protein [Curtobacterium sp. P97]